MKKIIFLLLFSTSIFANAKDTLEFSCDTEYNGKITIHSTPKKAYYIYRFYKNGQLKLVIKQNRKQTLKLSQEYLAMARYNVHSMYFKNGNYAYNVYSEWNYDPKNEMLDYAGGVLIGKAGDKNDLPEMLDCIKVYKALDGENLIHKY
ncbi:hypothetical protein ACKLNO_01395 [Neisseriaceae bacterium B1]